MLLNEKYIPYNLDDIESGKYSYLKSINNVPNTIIYGPHGCGKTTIARLLAQRTDLYYHPISAVFSGVADLRKIFDAAAKHKPAIPAIIPHTSSVNKSIFGMS